MSESGFASLGPSLLARKGGAKPAMRPQVAPLVADQSAIAEEQLEDLGWNDMGESDSASGAQIVPINADVSTSQITAVAGPTVRRQQRRLEKRLLADAAMTGPDSCEAEYDEADEALYDEAFDAEDFDEDGEAAEAANYAPRVSEPVSAGVPAAYSKSRVPATQSGRRAAFTLRLDADRHLKLRLAATMQGISAQALVTEALDRLLAEYGDLEVIANHLKRH